MATPSEGYFISLSSNSGMTHAYFPLYTTLHTLPACESAM
jgi:hypothetical protein